MKRGKYRHEKLSPGFELETSVRKTILSRLCNLHFKPSLLLPINSKPLPTYPINTSFTPTTHLPNPAITPKIPYIQQKSQHLGSSHSLLRHLYYPHKPSPTLSYFPLRIILPSPAHVLILHGLKHNTPPRISFHPFLTPLRDKQLSKDKSHPVHIPSSNLQSQRLRKPGLLDIKPTLLRLLF